MGHSVQVAGNTGCLYLMGNCIPYYEIREREWILMDCGSCLARTQLAEYLSKNKISVRAVLCSHGHYDHTENNRFLQEEYGAELVMSCLDAGILQDTLSLKTVFYSNTLQDNERECSDMLCKADQVILPGQEQVQVCGVQFRILSLPGHAASHMGFVTPDGVAYLADSMFDRESLKKGRLFYMLCWSQTLKTLEKIKNLEYKKYILAHYGVFDEVRELAEENIQRFKEILKDMKPLISEDITLEQLTEKVINDMGHPVKRLEKARLYERIVRSMLEYLLEQGDVSCYVRDNSVCYCLVK